MRFLFNNQWYYIDNNLAVELDSIVYNLKHDWDFVIIITGDRVVRVGKSILGLSVCAYLSTKMKEARIPHPGYSANDIYFDNKKMMKDAQTKPMYSILHYDEGREGLAASKSAKSFQQDLLDFFAECGQRNNIFVIVMPDFFDLKEEIAVARSEYLINVFRSEKVVERDLYHTGTRIPVVRLQRGFFEFYNRRLKKKMYDMFRTTRRKDYRLVRPQFVGRFPNQYPINEEEYRNLKKESFARFGSRKEDELASKEESKANKLYATHLELLYQLIKDKSKKEVSDMAEKYGFDTDKVHKWRLKLDKQRGEEEVERASMLAKDMKSNLMELKHGSISSEKDKEDDEL